MHKTFIKKIGSLLLLCAFINLLATEEKPWYDTFSQIPLQWIAAGTATALIIAKIFYNYYSAHALANEQIIQNYRSVYKKIYRDILHYHHFYHNDVQMSDWQLKEIIIESNPDSYPFITYYASLAKSSWVLKKHLVTLTNQLKNIDDYQKQLIYTHKTEKTAHLEEIVLQLTIKGKYLQEYILRTMNIVTILKKRIKLFKEYNDDCYNWAQEDTRNTHFNYN